MCLYIKHIECIHIFYIQYVIWYKNTIVCVY